MHHYYVVLGKPLELKLFQTSHPKTLRTDTSVDNIVSFAAIFWDVMQRSPQRNGFSHPTFLSWDKKQLQRRLWTIMMTIKIFGWYNNTVVDGVLLIKYEMKIKKHKFIYKIKMYVHISKAIVLQHKECIKGPCMNH